MTVRVAIIGGGWAGLSCAATLASQSSVSSKIDITVFEAAPHFGGRARGLTWNGMHIDNGQHLTIGAYHDTFDLLRMAGAPPWISEPLTWSGVSRNGLVAQRWQVPDIAWPLRFLQAMVPGFGPIHWPWAWKISMVRVLARLARSQWITPGGTVGMWLAEQDVPQGLIEHFWRPMTEGALNTEMEHASSQVLANVMRDSLGGPGNATRVLTPRHNLSINGVDRICDWLRGQGIVLLSGHRAASMAVGDDVKLLVHHKDQQVHAGFDAVVMALPAHATSDLWNNSGLPPTATSLRWPRLSARAITTVWLALPAPVAQKLAHLPMWFVLNPLPGVPHLAQVAVRREGILGLVTSARNHQMQPIDRSDDAPLLRQQLQVQLGIDIDMMEQKWITEKFATWACTPDAPIASPEESLGLTGVRHIYRCGDDPEPGYPATIESAVRSGKRTAQSLLASFGFINAR